MYFLAKWLIQLDGIGRITSLASEYKKFACELRVLGAEIADSEMAFLPFVLKAPSRDEINKVNTYEFNIKIDEWVEVSSKTFLTAYTLEVDPRFLMIEVSWLDGLVFYAFRNEDLIKSRNDKSQSNALYDIPLSRLNLSEKLYKSLGRTGITSVGDALDMLKRGEDILLKIRGVNEHLLAELVAKLHEGNYL